MVFIRNFQLALLSILATYFHAEVSANTSTRKLTDCDTLKACYLRDLSTGTEITLTGSDSYNISSTNSRGYSVRCAVNGKDGESDFIKFFFDGTFQDEFAEPRWMLGDSGAGAYIVPVPYLASCGQKTVKIQGHVWSNMCFEKTYSLTAQCDNASPTAPSAAAPSAAAPSGTAPTVTAPSARAPTVSAPSGTAPTGSAPSASAPSGAAPTVTAPTGIAPSASAPSGAAPTVTAPTGIAPSASAPSGAAPTVTAPTGIAPSASAPSGAAPTVSAPSASAPSVTAPTVTAPTGIAPSSIGTAPSATSPSATGPTSVSTPVARPPTVTDPSPTSPTSPSAPVTGPSAPVAPMAITPSAPKAPSSPASPPSTKTCKPGYKLVSGYCVVNSCESDFQCRKNSTRRKDRACYKSARDCECKPGYCKRIGGVCRKKARVASWCNQGRSFLGILCGNSNKAAEEDTE